MEHIVTVNPAWDYSFDVSLPLTSGSVSRARATRVEAGGKGVNVASMLRELGLPNQVPVQALIAGDDHFIDEAAQRCGEVKKIGEVPQVRVNLTLGPGVVAGVDPSAIIAGDESAPHEEAKINSSGYECRSEDTCRLAEEILSDLAPGDTLVLCGSLCLGMGADFYATLAKGARERHAWAVVDSSGASLREAWEEAHIVAPNLAEARELFASRADQEACQILEGLDSAGSDMDVLRAGLARLAQRHAEAAVPAANVEGVDAGSADAHNSDVHVGGPHWILLTLGGRGGALIGEGYAFYAPAPHVNLHSTVGAGDAALAGALWARALKLDPPEWLRWAVACGSAATETSGSQTPSYERICRLVVGIEVESL